MGFFQPIIVGNNCLSIQRNAHGILPALKKIVNNVEFHELHSAILRFFICSILINHNFTA